MQVIHEATMDDLEEVVILFDQYRIFYGQEGDMDNARNFIAARIKHMESVILLAKVEGENAGFAQMYPSFSSVSMKKLWILNDLFVIDKYRRKGVAQSLLDEAANYARKTNAKGLELSTAINNDIAQRLYERNGYEKDEVYVHYGLEV